MTNQELFFSLVFVFSLLVLAGTLRFSYLTLQNTMEEETEECYIDEMDVWKRIFYL